VSRERVFQPFFTSKRNGTGLGLALVQKIIVFHNGRVVAGASPAGGASLQVTLPLAWRESGVVVLLVLAASGFAGLRLLKGTWSPAQGQRPAWRERLAGIRESVLRFSTANPGRLWRAFGLGMAAARKRQRKRKEESSRGCGFGMR
jgi:hypothetical protein